MLKKQWTEDEVALFKEWHGKINCVEIQKRFFPNATVRQVQCLKRRAKLPNHNLRLISNRNTYNQHYFDELTNNNCYLGGLWAADGCLKRDSKLCHSLQHTSKDKDLLISIKEEINFSGPISCYIKKWNNKEFPIWKIKIGGIQNDWMPILNKIFKIVPRKTYCLVPPDLKDENHILAWIKGFIDGDGCICLKGKRLRISVVCHEKAVLDWILSIYQKYTATEAKVGTNKSGKLHSLEISGEIAYKMGKLIESSTPLGLSRKWSKLEEWRNNVSN